jgi:L-fuculose-phosphate aldolase
MNERGINRGTSGNVSVRVGEGLLITPSGLAYEELAPRDVVLLRLDGEVLAGERAPSTEWRLHCAILVCRPEVKAVVHAHAGFATSLAAMRRSIPPFHYLVALAGGDIRCAAYALFGSQALADHVVAALADRTACLMANHGMVAVGGSLAQALSLAIEVEALAEQFWRTLVAGGPVLLGADEMRDVQEKIRSYGQPRRSEPALSA